MSRRAPVEESAPSQTPDSLESLWREQKLVRNAELAMEVPDLDEAIRGTEAVASRNNGLVVDSEIRQTDGNRQAEIRVRVPSARFDPALEELRQIGTVDWEAVSTQDVTKAYTDLELRLSNKRRMEERLQTLLATNTGNLSAVLEVERELGRVVGEIEELLGEKRYFDHRISTSTIDLNLYEPPALLSPGFTAPVRKALGLSLTVLGTSVAAMIYCAFLVAPWLLLGIPLWWIVSRVKRKRKP